MMEAMLGGFYWKDGMPICRRCGHLVELFDYGDKHSDLKGQSKKVDEENSFTHSKRS